MDLSPSLLLTSFLIYSFVFVFSSSCFNSFCHSTNFLIVSGTKRCRLRASPAVGAGRRTSSLRVHRGWKQLSGSKKFNTTIWCHEKHDTVASRVMRVQQLVVTAVTAPFVLRGLGMAEVILTTFRLNRLY